MILKPKKTFGNGFKAKIYKHFVSKDETVLITNESSDSFYIAVEIDSVLYGVYEISTTEPYYSKLSYADGITQINDGNVKVVSAVGEVVYIKNEEDNIFIRLKKVVEGDSVSENYSVFTTTTNEFKGDLLSDDYTKLGDKETNKYYFMGEFNYMPIDDISETNAQILKGSFQAQETRSIRWDTDNVPLREDDIVVLENKAYVVGAVNTVFKARLTYYKSYTTTLLRIG